MQGFVDRSQSLFYFVPQEKSQSALLFFIQATASSMFMCSAQADQILLN